MGEITRYISKSFIPVFDRPVFQYGLEMLENSKRIDEIIILSNDENDQKLQQSGYRTIIQDDDEVFDMFSGWEFIKKATGTKKHGVLVPSDNISDIEVDGLIEVFLEEKTDLVFSLYRIKDKSKLSQMGCYDPLHKRFFYKCLNPPTDFGVLAPYIVRNQLKIKDGDQILSYNNIAYREHKGYWFDIGDFRSLSIASVFFGSK